MRTYRLTRSRCVDVKYPEYLNLVGFLRGRESWLYHGFASGLLFGLLKCRDPHPLRSFYEQSIRFIRINVQAVTLRKWIS